MLLHKILSHTRVILHRGIISSPIVTVCHKIIGEIIGLRYLFGSALQPFLFYFWEKGKVTVSHAQVNK